MLPAWAHACAAPWTRERGVWRPSGIHVGSLVSGRSFGAGTARRDGSRKSRPWPRVSIWTSPVYVVLSILVIGVAWSPGVHAAKVELAWTDTSTNESGFKIERRVDATGSFAQVAIVGPDAESYADRGLAAGVLYCYRVRAFNAGGDSGYTNEACLAAGGEGAGEPAMVTSAGPGGSPHVRAFTASGGDGPSFMAYDPAFKGGIDVALGRLNGGLTIVTGAGPGGGPHVQTFALDGSPSGVSFMAYDGNFAGGVRVASCDVDGDGEGEIITAPGPGGGPHVRVWKLSGTAAQVFSEFFAYDPSFTGGVFVACGDVDGAPGAEVITGAGAGGGPHVRVWTIAPDGTPAALASFFAYDPGFQGGVFVAAGDIDGNKRAEIVTGAGPGGGPHVRIWQVIAREVSELPGGPGFFAYDPAFTGGVRVAAADLDGDGRASIITAPGPGGGPHVRSFKAGRVPPGLSFFAFDPSFTGGVFVGGAPP
jgi:hypothetical protein